ncbi:MAG: fructosamine kinase family protein, partial [Gallionella sp.]
MNPKLLADISAAIRDATQRTFTLRNSTSVGGGSINDAFRLEGTDGLRFFLKLNDAQHLPMFVAEAQGLDAIASTNTIRVPRPLAHGSACGQSYLVLEHLELNSRGNAKLLGEQLAALHRCTSPFLPPVRGKARMGVEAEDNKVSTPTLLRQAQDRPSLPLAGGGSGGTSSCFGFAQDNFIGTTPQPNTWTDDWVTFWRERRLGFQLRLAAVNGYGGQLQSMGEKLMDTLPAFFKDYTPQPALLHGDLWSGNHAFLADGTPAIFDPATYYGDRECDLAMTELFGGYPADFYAAYRAAYPLDAGYATRRDLYNL